MEKVKIAFSKKEKGIDIINDLKSQIGSFDIKFIQFFTSISKDNGEISDLIYNSFGKVPTIGCSTSGEIISGQMLDNSVVLMAMGEEIIDDIKIEVCTDITKDSKSSVNKALNSFEKYYNQDISSLDTQKYVGIVLIDGLSRKEEKINELLGDLTNVNFVGGSAGDDLKFEKTYQYANGQTYTDSAVIALIKPKTKFTILKTQSFKGAEKQLTITKADEKTRTVIEINGKPAVEEYASLTKVKEGDIGNIFSKHPIGIKYEDDFFVRSPQQVDGTKIVFYCSIKEDMKLELLESQNIIDQTQKDLQSTISEFGEISALINFNCILRTIELKNKNQTEEYGKLFENIPTIGFSTYGESYIGHINQTAVMLIFK